MGRSRGTYLLGSCSRLPFRLAFQLLPDNNQGYSACDEAVGIVRGRDEVAGMEAFVGFYWTLPVNWSGFRNLPADVEAAAAKSRTIRYQRAMVQNWVRNNPPAELVDEIAFMDTRPDRCCTAGNMSAISRYLSAIPLKIRPQLWLLLRYLA